ncbi:MAG: ECF transporter S component [Oscillospiraceae bacterium]|nr:ECF transporter S component [Oscillospiraceae bacterium]
MDDQRSLEAQLLGDMTYDDPRKKQPANQGVDPRLVGASGAILEDMSAAAAPRPQAQPQYQMLTEEQIATLQQQRAANGQPPYTPDEIAELQAEFIERQRTARMQQAMQAQAAAQQAAAAALLAEDNYAQPEKPKAPEKVLPTVSASDLLEEPAPEPERKVVFNQEDIEAAKKQAVKKAADSLNSAPQTEADTKKAREEMRRFREQQLADMAAAGFKVSIIVTVVGILSALCMVLFGMGHYPDGEEMGGFFALADKFYIIGGIVLALLSITIVTRVQACRGFTSFMFIISSILLVVPGAIVLFNKKGADNFGFSCGCYVIAIIGCFAVTFLLSTNDKLSAYIGHKDFMYD